jgi:hypothetical protein
MWLLEQLARWKVILLLLVLYLGFSLFLFPFYQGQIDEIAGEPLKALDLRMQYSFEDAQTLLEKMQPEGRSIAQLISGRVDMVYPIVYGLFLLLLITRLAAKLKFRPKAWLLLTPVLAMLFDYLENIQVLRMLRQYPDISSELVRFSSLMSSLKWLFVLAAVLLVLILGGIQFILWLRHKPH